MWKTPLSSRNRTRSWARSFAPTSTAAAARARIKKFCAARLDAYKVPVKINFVTDILHSDRMKHLRTMTDKDDLT